MYQDIMYIYYIYVYLTDIYYSNWVYCDKLATLSTCAMVKSRYIGDGHPTFNDGILISWVYKPLRTWVYFFLIPYYIMEIMGVDRPDRTHTWRTIPVSKWLITMVGKSPKWGYSPYK